MQHRGLRKALLATTGGKCFYCNRPLAFKRKRHKLKVTIDHFIPLAKDGTNDFENLRPACFACNNTKGSMMPEEFLTS